MKSDEQLLTEMLPGEKDILGKVQEIKRKARNSALREAAEVCAKRKRNNEIIGSHYLASEALDCEQAILALIK